MTKALIAFGSTTGNTAEVANWVFETLEQNGVEVTLEDCAASSPNGLCDPYDLIVFGCPTYGDDEIEIQEDFEPILDELEKSGVNGKKVAVFGCGDSSYFHFCGAVDVIEKRASKCGASLAIKSLKIDDPHPDHEDEIRAWSTELVKAA